MIGGHRLLKGRYLYVVPIPLGGMPVLLNCDQPLISALVFLQNARHVEMIVSVGAESLHYWPVLE